MLFGRLKSASIFLRRFPSRSSAFADVWTVRLIPVRSKFEEWSTSRKDAREVFLCAYATAPAALLFWMSMDPVLAEEVSTHSNPENRKDTYYDVSLSRVDDGSVVSNVHTTKWRIFTDNGRDYFLQGKLEEAEKFFLSALEEAKQGFGERDPHVASACNNLAEFYRITKAFDKAEPLYLEAIKILEESFGPDDVRVGAAFHNLGQFHFVQRKLEEARKCYERALKIKGRVLGFGNPDYADTMYHLGVVFFDDQIMYHEFEPLLLKQRVLYLQGREKESEALIVDSIRSLEEAGEGESRLCIRRLRHLAQMYARSNRRDDAESVRKKINRILELSKI